MLPVRRSLFAAAGVFTAVNALTKVVPLLLLPILTHALTTQEFGRAALFIAISSLLIPLVGLRGDAVVLDVLAKTAGNPRADERFDFAMTVPLATSVFLLVALGTALTFGVPLKKVVGIDWNWMIVAILTALLWSYLICGNALWQFTGRLRLYCVVQLSQAVGVAVLTAGLVLGPLPDASGRMLGYVSPILILGGWSAVRLFCQFGVRPRLTLSGWKVYSSVALPLFVGTLASLFASTVDRFAISTAFGVGAVGIYAFGSTVGLTLAVITEGIDLAWLPYVAKSTRADGSRRVLVGTALVILLGIIAVAAVLYAMIPLLVDLLGRGKGYGAAAPIAAAALVATVGKAGFNLVSAVAIYSGRRALSIVISSVLAVVMPVAIWLSVSTGELYAPLLAIAAAYMTAAIAYFVVLAAGDTRSE